MALHQKSSESHPSIDTAMHPFVDPIFARAGELTVAPQRRLPQHGMRPDTAYQIVHDELMLDGNARLNLATFVTTWMEPQAEKLMSETFDKNMIDKDEYPRTAEIEMRCVNMLAKLWHSPHGEGATGTSTIGSSEAAMLGGMALKWRWRERERAAGKPTDRPNMVMGINVQVCWEKFCRYWDVEMRLVPMEGDRLHLDAAEAVKYCDENTIGVIPVLGSTFDGSYEPVAEICAALDGCKRTPGSTSRCTSTARPVRSSRRSSIPISSGTSASLACSRSTRPATSTDSCTRASVGSSGARRKRCPKSSCSG